MDLQFTDRSLNCSDCHGEFVFTAGEQLFFFEKQFKNDPKRCKPCKLRRSGLSAVANGTGPVAAGLSRTETRTDCSECGVETTVPFKPTQGRPVLCRQCFQNKNKAIAASQAALIPAAATASALANASIEADGMRLSADAAVVAAALMASAPAHSSIATPSDLASIASMEAGSAQTQDIPVELLAGSEMARADLLLATISIGERADA